MERRPLTKRPLRIVAAVALVVLIVAAAGAVVTMRTTSASPAAQLARLPGADARAPAGVRIRVEVFNATRTRGLGRRATRWLRDGGFDVVYTGTSRKEQDSTVVIDRSGHPDWAALIAQRLGGARVESRPDSSRYLDATVFIGASFRPPPQTLYP